MKKLKNKITLILVLTISIIALILGSVSVYQMSSSTEKNSYTYLMEAASIAGTAAQKTIESYTNVVSEVANSSIITGPEVSAADKKAYLAEKIKSLNLNGAGILDKKGISETGKDFSNQEFFEKSMNGQAYMTAPYVTEDGKNVYQYVSAPVKNNGSIVGVVYFDCDANILNELVSNIVVGEFGDAYILDKNGTTIAYKDKELVLNQENVVKNYDESNADGYEKGLFPIETAMIAGETGCGSYPQEDQIFYQGYAPVPGSDGWSIAVTADKSEMTVATRVSIITLVILTVAIMVIGLVVARIIGGSISKPIELCTDRLKLLAAGDLTSETPKVNSKDETRSLAESTEELVKEFNRMISDTISRLKKLDRGDLTKEEDADLYRGDFLPLQSTMTNISESLNETIKHIIIASEEVFSGSERVSTGSTTLAQGATEQASAIEELSSAISEITSKINETAENSINANNLSAASKEKLIEGKSYMGELSEAMADIDARSGEISKIVKAIDDIAFQTNILALNAAVEAARAGAAGKGFAVVADEVRNLANKSAEAAKSTTVLIESSVIAAKRGTELTGVTAETLEDVMERASNSATFVEGISADTKEQARAISEVSIGINQIASVVQINSETSEESAMAAAQLSSQAIKMKELVSKFKVN